jgi:hypothetical protein
MNIGTPREKSYLVENIPRVRDLRLLYEFTMNLKAVLEPIVVANIATAQSMTPPERGLHATSTYLHIVFPEIANHGLWRFVCSCSKVRRLYNTESDISKYIEEIYAAIYKNKMGGEKARRVYIDIVYNKGYYNTHHLQSDIHKQIIARAVVPAPQ